MIPTIGRIVTVHGMVSNGAIDHPAIITRVWGGNFSTERGAIAVNLTMFPDNAPPRTLSSVMLYHTGEAARAACGAHPGAHAAHWPDRA